MDSLEDRIAQAGKYAEFEAAYNAFENSNMSREKQHDFYETLTNLGASPEEADEFISMVIGDYE